MTDRHDYLLRKSCQEGLPVTQNNKDKDNNDDDNNNNNNNNDDEHR